MFSGKRKPGRFLVTRAVKWGSLPPNNSQNFSVVTSLKKDVLGHLTTRFYVGMFDDAEIGWVDARHVIEYQREVLAGDLLEISAGVTRIDNKSMTVCYDMKNLGDNETAATMEVVYVLFDLQERHGIALTDELREMAQKHLLETDRASFERENTLIFFRVIPDG